MKPFDYERDTLHGYRDPAVARDYDELSHPGSRGLRGLLAREVARRERLAIGAALDRVFAGRAADSLLDVPCGAGKLAPVLRGRARRVIAADASPAMLERARAAFVEAGVDVVLREVDAAALPFDDASFDAVVCLRLLHRVPHPLRVRMIAQLARVASRAVIVSFGIVDPVQRFRLGLRWRILPGSPVPVPCSRMQALELLAGAGLVNASGRPVLPGLSSEWIFTAEKR